MKRLVKPIDWEQLKFNYCLEAEKNGCTEIRYFTDHNKRERAKKKYEKNGYKIINGK